MIHKYSMNGYNIVLDVHSGSIHVFDDLAFFIIDLFKDNTIEEIQNKLKNKYNEKDITQAYKEIVTLKNDNTLFSEDVYEHYIKEIDKRNPIVKAMCLHVTHDCNLKCKYCFAEEGEYNLGKRALMSFEVGKKALDYLIHNSGSRINLEVDFFGGEPLMNFDVVKKLVSYGRCEEKKYNKKFRFTITTNGVLLDDEIMDYINENMHNVVLSIDGRKKINDAMRFNYGGQGTYEKIVPKFKKFADKRKHKEYYVRGTFTRNNLDFAEDVLHLSDLGFEQISVEPVVAQDNMDYAIKEEDKEIIYIEYENLAKEILKRDKEGKAFNFFHFMLDLTGGPCVAKRLVGCGAGTEYLAVTPDGDLYPCHQFVGNEQFNLGNLDDGIKKVEIVKDFEAINVYTKEECKICWAKFYCSGGCISNAYNFTGNIKGNYKLGCDLQKKRVECAIMIKVAKVFGNSSRKEKDFG